jgi:hypothetical protein
MAPLAQPVQPQTISISPKKFHGELSAVWGMVALSLGAIQYSSIKEMGGGALASTVFTFAVMAKVAVLAIAFGKSVWHAVRAAQP